MKILSVNKIKSEPITHSKSILKKVFAKKGQIPHISQIGQVELKSGNIVPEHKHENMHEIFYILSGAGIIKINGEVHQVKAGDYILIEPGDAHEFLNNTAKPLSLFYFEVTKK